MVIEYVNNVYICKKMNTKYPNLARNKLGFISKTPFNNKSTKEECFNNSLGHEYLTHLCMFSTLLNVSLFHDTNQPAQLQKLSWRLEISYLLKVLISSQ